MSANAPQKRKWIILLKCMVSGGILGFLLTNIPVHQIQENIKSIDPAYAIAGLGLSFVMVAASTWKWSVLLNVQGTPIPFFHLYRWYFIGYFYSNFLPSNMGGDVARSWLAGSYKNSHVTALTSILVERFTGMLFLLLLAAGLPFLKPQISRMPAVWIGSLVGTCGLVFMFSLLWLARRSQVSQQPVSFCDKVNQFLQSKLSSKPATYVSKFMAKLKTLMAKLDHLNELLWENPKVLAQVFFLTALYYGLAILNVCLAFRAFGTWPDVAGIAAVLPVALMVAMIPISLGGLGITEGAYVFYFGLVGLDGGLTLLMGIFLRMKILILGLVGFVFNLVEPVRK